MTDEQGEFGSVGIEDGTRRQVIFPYPDRLSHHVTAQCELARNKQIVML